MSDNAARRRWQKRYRYDRAHGRSHAVVPVGPARDHVTSLLDAGFTASSIARAAGVPHDTVLGIAEGFAKGRQPGRATIQRPTARRILGVGVADIIAATGPTQLVPHTGAQRRIRALQRMGWTIPAIAAAVPGLSHHNVRRAAYNGTPGTPRNYISRTLHDQIAAAYDALSMTPGPSNHSRTVAKREGYYPPMAWDDDTIDDPRVDPDLGKGSPGRLGSDDAVWIATDVRTWTAFEDRTGLTRSYLRVALRRVGRADLVDRLDVHTYGDTRTGRAA